MAFARTKIPDFELANPLYAGSSVRFFTVDPLTGLPTAVLATLYMATFGIETAANPQILDSEGKVQRPVYCDVPVIGLIAGIHVADHQTGIINPGAADGSLDEARYAAGIAEDAAGAAIHSAFLARRFAAIAAANLPDSDQHILANRVFNGD